MCRVSFNMDTGCRHIRSSRFLFHLKDKCAPYRKAIIMELSQSITLWVLAECVPDGVKLFVGYELLLSRGIGQLLKPSF